MIFYGVGGIVELIILGVMLLSSIIFSIMDIRKREVNNCWIYAYAGIMLPLGVCAYILDYVPNFGFFCILFVVSGLLIPFLWWFFMKGWIGEADCKWLMITFLVLPEFILIFTVLMIVFTLLNHVVFVVLKKKDKPMPEMIPLACCSFCICVMNVVIMILG